MFSGLPDFWEKSGETYCFNDTSLLTLITGNSDARYLMSFANILESRDGLAAFWDGHKAARMEGATRGWIQGAGHFTLQDDAFPLFLDKRVGNGDGGEQGSRIGMQGVVVEYS